MDYKATPVARSWFSWLCSLVQSPLLLVIRLVWGILFLQAGIAKFAGMSETIAAFQDLNIPYSVWMAYAVAFFETVGGAFLILGLWTRLMALPLVVIMLSAAFFAHQAEVIEAVNTTDLAAVLKINPFTYLIAALTLMGFGPGVFSLDWIVSLFGRKKKEQKEHEA